MQARTAISRKKISTSVSYFSGDERQPSNGTELKNSGKDILKLTESQIVGTYFLFGKLF